MGNAALPFISMKNMIKKYQIGDVENTVLKAISLDVCAGDMMAIVGASGSGKSTLMNIIGLLDKATSGQYYLDQRDIATLSTDEQATYRNKHIGFVFQQFNLLPRFNALQNVSLPLFYRDLPLPEIEQAAHHALKRVGMGAYHHHKPNQLSGGQQQRVAIARALVGEPRVILADEPTGALDSQTGTEIMQLFLSLHQEGRTLILVTHDEHIASQCQRQITLADGNIIAEIHR